MIRQRLRLRTLISLVVPLTIAIYLVVSTGPSLQNYVITATTAPAPNLYDAAYPDGLVHFPSYGAWLIEGINPYYIILSLVVALASLSRRRFLDTSITTILTLFFGLMVIDIIGVSLCNCDTTNNILLDLVFNLSGSILISIYIVSLLVGSEAIDNFKLSNLQNCALTAIYFLLSGLFIGALIYGLIYVLYEPLPASVRATIHTSNSGVFMQDKTQFIWETGRKKVSKDHQFGFLPVGQIDGGAINVSSPGGRSKIEWVANSSALSYTAQVTLAQNCPLSFDKIYIPKPASLVFSKVRHITAEFDNGMSYGASFHDGKSENTISINNPSFYFLNSVKSKDKYSIQYFMSQDTTFKQDLSDGVIFEIFAPLLKENNKKIDMAARILNFKIDNRIFNIKFIPPPSIPKEKLVCTPLLQITDRQLSGNAPIYLKYPFATIIVQVRGENKNSYYVDEGTSSSIRYSGINGWLTLKDVLLSDTSNDDLGALSLVTYRGLNSETQLNGVDVKIRPADTVVMLGHFKAYRSQNNGFTITGDAGAIWQSDQRLNKTRWELIPHDLQLWLISAIVGLLIGLARLLKPVYIRMIAKTPFSRAF